MSSVVDWNMVMQHIPVYGMSVTPNQATNGSCGYIDHYVSHKQGNEYQSLQSIAWNFMSNAAIQKCFNEGAWEQRHLSVLTWMTVTTTTSGRKFHRFTYYNNSDQTTYEWSHRESMVTPGTRSGVNEHKCGEGKMKCSSQLL